jgi:hypothetical protein
MDLDLIITRSKINLGEHLSTCQLIEQEVDAWQWVPVLDCHRIEWSIIDAQSQCLILLHHKESGAALWRGAWPDIPLIQELLQLDL